MNPRGWILEAFVLGIVVVLLAWANLSYRRARKRMTPAARREADALLERDLNGW